jgi:hypothetical protein
LYLAGTESEVQAAAKIVVETLKSVEGREG